MPREHVISGAQTKKYIYTLDARAEIEQSAHVSTVWERDSAPAVVAQPLAHGVA
jgi:hypothetical protein